MKPSFRQIYTSKKENLEGFIKSDKSRGHSEQEFFLDLFKKEIFR